ncbi:MAG: hypothetical protein ACTHNW_06170 [Mucilaginibacter sp.]
MKKLIYLFSIAIALTIFTSTSASAQTLTPSVKAPGVMCDFLSDLLAALFGNNSNNTTTTTTTSGGSNCNNTPSTQLPINGGVEFLMIAGVIIGIVTVQRDKTAKTAAVTLQK